MNRNYLFYSKNSEMSHESAVQYGTAIFVVTVISSLGTIHYYFHALHYAMKVRVAICSLIYRQVCFIVVFLLSKYHPFYTPNSFLCILGFAIVTKGINGNGTRKIGQFAVKWCKPIRCHFRGITFIVGISAIDDYRCLYSMDRDSMGRHTWNGDHLFSGAITK